MAGVSFTLGLVDRLSGPAKQAGASVQGLTADLTKARAELSRFQRLRAGAREFGSSGDFLRYSDAARQARERVYQLTKQTDGMSAATGASIPVIGAVVTALTAMAAAYGKITLGIIHATNAEQSFNRQSLASYTALAGSAKLGQQTYDQIELLTKRLPFAKEQLSGWTKTLQESGVTDIRKGVLALSGSEALVGKEGPEQLLTTIRKVQEAVQTGQGLKMADRQLAQLAKTGANVDDVAKAMGVSAQVLRNELKAGTVDAGQFGTALLDAVEKKGRKPLRLMWLDLDVLEKKAGEFAQNLFQNVDLGPALDAVTDFINLMDEATDTGSSLADGVKSGADGVIKAFGGIVNEVTVAGLKMATFALDAETGLIKVENRLNNIVNYLKSIPGRLGALAHGDFDALKMPDANTADAPDVRAAKRLKITQLAKDFAVQRTSGALKGADLQLAADKLVDLLHARVKEGVITPKEDIAIQAAALGSAAVKGFKDGVDKGKGVSEDAGAGMGHAAIKGARGPKGVDAHSPSRKAFAVGKDVAAGLSLGMSTGVDRAAAYMGDQASRASLYAAAAGGHPGGVNASPSSRHPGDVSVSEINIVAPHGVTDAAQLSAYGLSIALERQQLMSGA